MSVNRDPGQYEVISDYCKCKLLETRVRIKNNERH